MFVSYLILFTSGCSYPDSYRQGYCARMFACEAENAAIAEVIAESGWASEGDCNADQAKNQAEYDGCLGQACTLDAEYGDFCLSQQAKASCGDMEVGAWIDGCSFPDDMYDCDHGAFAACLIR